jgi:aspartyl-tRNA(Asn)/glutamyl-tRNA(Gln) amidotransferase subunit A
MERSLGYAGLTEISTLIRQRQLSPLQIVELCLERIERLNPKLNALITTLADQAREQASAADTEIKAGRWRGPLHGIPIGIKDFYDTAGIKTTAAVEQFRNRIPANDAKGVAKLKQAGAILLGKMNMDSLGMGTTGLESYFGPVHNPWNVGYIAGGSSSGSAAAVASGMCYATLDTDAIGSCRLPAACCGVVGFKGTYGFIDPKGILEGEEPPDEMIIWLSHPAITARSVEDIAIVLQVLAEQNDQTRIYNFLDGMAQNRKVRIGVTENFHADHEVSEAFEKAVEIIRGLHHPLSRAAVPFHNLSDGIGNIQADRAAIAEQAFQDIDVFLLPTMTSRVPAVKDTVNLSQGLSPENTFFANYYGLPAISIPCAFDTNGLPVGLQIVGKPWDDTTVLSMAYQFQMAAEFRNKRPIA